MPNMLAHFALQGAASRGAWRRIDLRFIYLGCLLPDMPWILRRALAAVDLPVDALDLRLYLMAQASLAGTLLLAAALAAVSTAPRPVFAVLGSNALAHLLLDASEVKWGNGVHLLAPFSWRMTSFDLVDGEYLAVWVLTVAGGLLVAWDLVRRPRHATTGFDLRRARLAVAGSVAALYLLAPLAFLGAIEASDSYSVRTLREVERRPGRSIGLDRARFLPAPEGGRVVTWTGESVRVTGPTPQHAAVVSLRGTFVTPHLLRVDRLVEQRTNRNLPSYVAVALLALLWIRRPGAPRRPLPPGR